MKTREPVRIGDHLVGDGHPTLFVAEIGTFFNKDVDLACEYVTASVEAGAPVLKTEVLHSADVCLPGTGMSHKYNHANGDYTEDYRALIERKVIPLNGYRRIFAHCRDLGVPFIASCYDSEGVDLMVETGGAAIKLARDNIDNIPLIRYASATGLPIIFDAGHAYLDEVAAAVRNAREAGAGGVIVNHHPGANPAPASEHNLALMASYKDTLDVPVGLSCHYRGDEILYAAIGIGVNLIEKGVVEDPDRVEQDLVSAASLSELAEIIRKVRNCWDAIGTPYPEVSEPRDLSTRKGLVAKRDIAPGEEFDESNLRYAWPPEGVSVRDWDVVEGRQAKTALQAGEPLTWDSVRRSA